MKPVRLLGLVCGIAAMAPAESRCPWMNATTATGLLGGDVSVTSAIKKPKEIADRPQDTGSCEFARTSGSTARLRIEVAVMQSPKTEFAGYLGKCVANAKQLKAIGNEAVTCEAPPNGKRVVGRVRDQAFVITLTAAEKPDALGKAAEIVAGNLF